jgi:hypothetical protein
MRTITLDPDMLEVETFATHSPRALHLVRFADTDDAECDTESGPPDCDTVGDDCETFDCSGVEMCGEPTEDC